MTASAHHPLLEVSIFRGLTEAEAQRLSALADEVNVPAGQPVFQEGDPGDFLYVLLEGSVEVRKRGDSGAWHALAVLGKGNVLGELSLLGGTGARSAAALATAPVKLLRFPTQRFSELRAQYDLAALKVVNNLAQVLSRRLLMMDNKLMQVLDRSQRKEELSDFQRILNDWSF